MPLRTNKHLVRWDDVASVSWDSIPSRGYVTLHSGTRVYLPISQDQVPVVAAIGGKEVVKATYRLSPPAPSPRPTTAIADPERDLRNRAAALAAENARMSAELEVIRRRRAARSQN